MSERVYKSLAQSLREAGAIFRGEAKDFRQFTRKQNPTRNPSAFLAVCINGDENLIDGKIYAVKITANRILVKDESGENVLCPPEDFLLVKFQPKIEKILRQLVSVS